MSLMGISPWFCTSTVQGTSNELDSEWTCMVLFEIGRPQILVPGEFIAPMGKPMWPSWENDHNIAHLQYKMVLMNLIWGESAPVVMSYIIHNVRPAYRNQPRALCSPPFSLDRAGTITAASTRDRWVKGTGAHFTQKLTTAITEQQFLHMPLQFMSCHVQNFVMVTELQQRWELNKFAITFELQRKNLSWTEYLP